MTEKFADTYYWIALLNDCDQGHAAAQAMSRLLENDTLVTTHEVLSELLTFFCEHGLYVRRVVSPFVRAILTDPSIRVVPQSQQSFMDGLGFYEARSDKGYSHTDCISILTMRHGGIREILTDDHHFTQEGFLRLL